MPLLAALVVVAGFVASGWLIVTLWPVLLFLALCAGVLVVAVVVLGASMPTLERIVNGRLFDTVWRALLSLPGRIAILGFWVALSFVHISALVFAIPVAVALFGQPKNRRS